VAVEIHVGDVGTAIRLHLLREDKTAMDVSTATLLEFTVASPNNRRKVWAAHAVTTGVDGQVQYIVGPGDLDVAGSWKIQAHVIVGGGEWRSDIIRFSVIGNL
jgi:hypothetical protein